MASRPAGPGSMSISERATNGRAAAVWLCGFCHASPRSTPPKTDGPPLYREPPGGVSVLLREESVLHTGNHHIQQNRCDVPPAGSENIAPRRCRQPQSPAADQVDLPGVAAHDCLDGDQPQGRGQVAFCSEECRPGSLRAAPRCLGHVGYEIRETAPPPRPKEHFARQT